VVRVRFRDSLDFPTLIKPGEVYEYTIDMWSTSHVFKAGHRIRLEVSSSNFPRYDRNQNTGHDLGADAETRPAQQAVFHDSNYPSRLILPVIPR
jgi:putative CocE/NonD family hydrolase